MSRRREPLDYWEQPGILDMPEMPPSRYARAKERVLRALDRTRSGHPPAIGLRARRAWARVLDGGALTVAAMLAVAVITAAATTLAHDGFGDSADGGTGATATTTGAALVGGEDLPPLRPLPQGESRTEATRATGRRRARSRQGRRRARRSSRAGKLSLARAPAGGTLARPGAPAGRSGTSPPSAPAPAVSAPAPVSSAPAPAPPSGGGSPGGGGGGRGGGGSGGGGGGGGSPGVPFDDAG